MNTPSISFSLSLIAAVTIAVYVIPVPRIGIAGDVHTSKVGMLSGVSSNTNDNSAATPSPTPESIELLADLYGIKTTFQPKE